MRHAGHRLWHTLICAGVKKFEWVFPAEEYVCVTNGAVFFTTFTRLPAATLMPVGGRFEVAVSFVAEAQPKTYGETAANCPFRAL